MMNFDAPAVETEAKQLFGQDFTREQLSWLVKVIKHCRGRCRSNVALYNYLNRNFSNARFSDVVINGYETLKIEMKESAC